ncbi:hypothetical protein SpCBS45565_g01199 [Spizellomyces sp. 'palustris']|nr:hypothetical protein SpCBS45565_g01199 [Spizellomyces sp. 'palustris']
MTTLQITQSPTSFPVATAAPSPISKGSIPPSRSPSQRSTDLDLGLSSSTNLQVQSNTTERRRSTSASRPRRSSVHNNGDTDRLMDGDIDELQNELARLSSVIADLPEPRGPSQTMGRKARKSSMDNTNASPGPNPDAEPRQSMASLPTLLSNVIPASRSRQPSLRATIPRAAFSDATIERRLQSIPSEMVDLLQVELGQDLDVRGLMTRLRETEENVINKIVPRNRMVDLSSKVADKDIRIHKENKQKIEGTGEDTFRGLCGLSYLKKGWRKLRKRANSKGECSLAPSATLQSSSVHPAIDPTRPLNSAPPTIPPPPPHLEATDNIQLAIYYHESDNLDVSVYYLERSALEGHPLGLYLLGMCLRHGWGVQEDRIRAVRCFVRGAEASIVGVADVWKRWKDRQAHPMSGASGSSSGTGQHLSPGELTSSIERSSSKLKTGAWNGVLPTAPTLANGLGISPSCDSLPTSSRSHGMIAPPRSSSLFPSLTRRPSSTSRTSTVSRPMSTWSIFATASRIITSSPVPTQNFTSGDVLTDLSITRSILPLPLYELGICFRHGWGVAKSLPAAFYFLRAAACAGDPDAMIETGYCLLNGVGVKKDRKESAKWFRNAVQEGKEVVGEGWIWKEKWM